MSLILYTVLYIVLFIITNCLTQILSLSNKCRRPEKLVTFDCKSAKPIVEASPTTNKFSQILFIVKCEEFMSNTIQDSCHIKQLFCAEFDALLNNRINHYVENLESDETVLLIQFSSYYITSKATLRFRMFRDDTNFYFKNPYGQRIAPIIQFQILELMEHNTGYTLTNTKSVNSFITIVTKKDFAEPGSKILCSGYTILKQWSSAACTTVILHNNFVSCVCNLVLSLALPTFITVIKNGGSLQKQTDYLASHSIYEESKFKVSAFNIIAASVRIIYLILTFTFLKRNFYVFIRPFFVLTAAFWLLNSSFLAMFTVMSTYIYQLHGLLLQSNEASYSLDMYACKFAAVALRASFLSTMLCKLFEAFHFKWLISNEINIIYLKQKIFFWKAVMLSLCFTLCLPWAYCLSLGYLSYNYLGLGRYNNCDVTTTIVEFAFGLPYIATSCALICFDIINTTRIRQQNKMVQEENVFLYFGYWLILLTHCLSSIIFTGFLFTMNDIVFAIIICTTVDLLAALSLDLSFYCTLRSTRKMR